MTPVLSVVIPTHKRAAILWQTLEHLERQTIADQIEVVVVSDGPDEDTRAIMEKLRVAGFGLRVKFFEIQKSHQGVARNRGMERTTAPFVLFIGDDIFLAPEACERHLGCHGERSRTTSSSSLSPFDYAQGDNCAVLGFTTWDPSLTVTPVMRWLERSGWQFGYPMIEEYAHTFIPSELQHRFTYTSHISLPTSIARQFPFREDVSLYGWEDIEWGMRLRKAGVRLFYEPDTKAYHHHPLTLEQSLKRMETLGASAVHFSKIVPELDRLPRGWKKVAYHLIALLPTMRGRHSQAFLRGIAGAQKR